MGEVLRILWAFAVAFGWGIVASVAMGLGIIIVLKLFHLSTPKVDEWDLVQKGNIPIAIILAAVIMALGIVIASALGSWLY